jgi:hypothetical protein
VAAVRASPPMRSDREGLAQVGPPPRVAALAERLGAEGDVAEGAARGRAALDAAKVAKVGILPPHPALFHLLRSANHRMTLHPTLSTLCYLLCLATPYG